MQWDKILKTLIEDSLEGSVKSMQMGLDGDGGLPAEATCQTFKQRRPLFGAHFIGT
jgi:hypothetical protein